MYSIEWESLRSVLDAGVEDLIAEHWEEVEHDKEKIALAPDWDRAHALEKMGVLRIIGVRNNGALVGYNAFHVLPHIHSRYALYAFNDVLFIEPEHRGSAGVKLIRAAERKLKDLGVVRIIYGSKPWAKIGRRGTTTGDILIRMGYGLYEELYSKLM